MKGEAMVALNTISSDRSLKRNTEVIWSEYKKTKTIALRNELTLHYGGLVVSRAIRIHSRGIFQHLLELDDLISVGNIALMKGIEDFDENRHAKFETYCYSRIRGAMSDEIRSIIRAKTGISHPVCTKARKFQRDVNQLTMSLGRKPTAEEIQIELKLNNKSYQKILKVLKDLHRPSLHRIMFVTDSGEKIPGINFLEGSPGGKAEQEVESRELREIIIRGLDERLRTILINRDFEGYNYREIATMLSMSIFGVHRLHSSAWDNIKLKPALQKLFDHV